MAYGLRRAAIPMALVLVVAGVATTAGGWLSSVLQARSSAAEAPAAPISLVARGLLDPALLLQGLAGEDPSTTIDRALSSGRLADAYAIAVLDANLADQSRAGTLLVLGQRYRDANEPALALSCLHTAASVATLSPNLGDAARASLLLNIAQELTTQGDSTTALQTLDRVEELIQYSGAIPDTYRALTSRGLADEYRRLGKSDQAAAVDALPAPVAGRSLDSTPLESLLVPENNVLTGIGPRALDLVKVQAQRQEAAAKLAAALAGGAPGASATPNETLRQSLEALLVNEDGVMAEAYKDGLNHLVDPASRAALAGLHVRWLEAKWRAAHQYYGVSLVSEWESGVAAIDNELRQAYDEYFLLLRDAAISLPTPEQASEANGAALQAQLVAGTLGFYPQAPISDIQRSLDQASQFFVQAHSEPALHLTARSDSGGRVFVYSLGGVSP